MTDFEQQNAGGKHLSVAHWSSPFNASFCSGNCNFDATTFQKARDNGVIPFFSWANTGIRDADVAAGAWDGYIRSWASAAKSWGHPFFLRFDWEMNGSWFDWGVGNDGTSAADYVAAWRRVHDIFASVGATNATWVWCPNIDPREKLADLGSVYPGDSYVDWTCLDGYNGNDPWMSFTNLFADTYDKIMEIAPAKPMIIGEVGSTESGGSKAQWIGDMFAALATRFPNIRGVLWFDQNVHGPGGYSDWPVETSSSSSAAFAAGIRSSAFATNTFATLAESRIRPPRRWTAIRPWVVRVDEQRSLGPEVGRHRAGYRGWHGERKAATDREVVVEDAPGLIEIGSWVGRERRRYVRPGSSCEHCGG